MRYGQASRRNQSDTDMAHTNHALSCIHEYPWNVDHESAENGPIKDNSVATFGTWK